jgi:Tfp pilus assembly major pilin PilA
VVIIKEFIIKLTGKYVKYYKVKKDIVTGLAQL